LAIVFVIASCKKRGRVKKIPAANSLKKI